MKIPILPVFFAGIITLSCGTEYYSIDDYQSTAKIDAHFHIYSDSSSAIDLAARDNFRLMSINTYAGNCNSVIPREQAHLGLKKLYGDDFEYSTTFCLEGFEEEGWTDRIIKQIDSSIEQGAASVKIWKNIGMALRNSEGELVMVDDPVFDDIFNYLENEKIPLVAHLAEPMDCWLPVEKMIAGNNRYYFTDHPEYHMYLHPEMPSHEEQMRARARMMKNHPRLIFIGCHLASMEWDVDVLAAFLDDFPNASVDMAARMGELFYQTIHDREKVRDFFTKYQDRIMYGTDIIERTNTSPEALYERMHKDWTRDWEYMVTDNEMESWLVEEGFRGLKLPQKVIDKIYHDNAKDWYGGF